MIIDFSISNFRSIREEQTLSFEATGDKHLESFFVVQMGKYRLLKLITILGANASGKSNVLKAFYMLPKLMLHPCQDKTSVISYARFALDEACSHQSSKLSVNFIVEDRKYAYHVEFDNTLVYNELLRCQPFVSTKEHTVYSRTTDVDTLLSTISWGDKYRSADNSRLLMPNLLHNRTLFGAYLHSNVDMPWMKAIIQWLRAYFMPMVATQNQGIKAYVSHQLVDKLIDKQELVRQLAVADFGVCELEVEQKKQSLDPQVLDLMIHDDNLPRELRQKLVDDPTGIVIDVRMSHQGHQGKVFFDYGQESAGTQRYYELSGLLVKVIREPHFLAIDELECRLHPDLYMHFINTYVRNSTHSQIIFSSHSREFLADRDTYRDDTVYLTEKSEMGDTMLYSLADFDTKTLRGASSRYNAYRAGRLGGIPTLGDTYMPDSL